MKKLLYNTLSKSTLRSARSPSSESGFSLIELAVIVVIIGVFSAIAAPAWNAFVTRQRIRAVNNQVLQALQTAQAEAKRNKENITVTFDNTEDPPEYQIETQPTQTIDLEGEVPEGEIQLETLDGDGNPANEVTFNYLGSVINKDNPDSPPPLPFKVIVSPFDSTNSPSQRCVIVQTLLGAMRTAEGNDNTTGCG
ncbi:MAG: type II secretion system protein [Cyanobacteriota bacterium]|nr:type II secretion system protein [Cyanobacteriota bacterium]